MRLKLLLPCLTVALLAAAGMTFWSGCDTGSATENIEINPAAVTLSKGQTQVFTVSGGYDYTWSLSPDNGGGKLDTRHGDTVTFQMLTDTAGTIQIVCTSLIAGTPQGSAVTNSQSGYSETATALVHSAIPETNSPSGPLTVTPTSHTINTSGSLTLNASGGDGTYNWEVSGSGTGDVTPKTGSSVVTYTTIIPPTANVTNTVTVTDASGDSARCTITVKP